MLLLPPEGQPETKANACLLLIDEHGERVARYNKLYLFDVDIVDVRGHYRESDDYAFGQEIVVADTPVGRLGLTVCYDLRFPELCTTLREAGVEPITAPSASTAVTGAAHWQALIRARAIETQCHLLAAGQGDVHPRDWEMFGHSAIVDLWDRVLAERPQDETALLTMRDAAEQASTRQRIPVVAHR